MKFAKLFERDGRQVLVTTDTHDETGAPGIVFRTKTLQGGHDLKLSMEFKDTERGREQRDYAFGEINADKAFGVVERAPGYDL